MGSLQDRDGYLVAWGDPTLGGPWLAWGAHGFRTRNPLNPWLAKAPN